MSPAPHMRVNPKREELIYPIYGIPPPNKLILCAYVEPKIHIPSTYNFKELKVS